MKKLIKNLTGLFNAGQTKNEEIILVSGLPRSGTSMMMKMIEAGGVPVMIDNIRVADTCLLYTSPSPRDRQKSRMPSSA